jgi:hypothetical protein
VTADTERTGKIALGGSDNPGSIQPDNGTGGTRVALAEVIDDHFLARYRALLDAEDVAFDELEHAFEDGDRAHFDADLCAWRTAVGRKLDYLHRLGLVMPPALSA